MLFATEFATSSVMDTDNGLKCSLALSIALLFIPAALPPQRSAGFLSGQPTPGSMGNSPACLSYEPSVVQLSGTVIRETFPGPPNYESIERGDKPEVLWWLVLSQPICMEEDVKEPSLSPAQRTFAKSSWFFAKRQPTKLIKNSRGIQSLRKVRSSVLAPDIHHTGLLLTVTTLTKAGWYSIPPHSAHPDLALESEPSFLFQK